MCQYLSVSIAEALAVLRNTANDAVLAEGRRVLINDPGRFDGVAAIGVDEHAWRHTRRGNATTPARRGCWTWSKAAPSRCLRPGCTPNRTSSGTGSPATRSTHPPSPARPRQLDDWRSCYEPREYRSTSRTTSPCITTLT